jgi:hypothetical protein
MLGRGLSMAWCKIHDGTVHYYHFVIMILECYL